MLTGNDESKTVKQLLGEINKLRWQLKEANSIIDSIRESEVESKEQSRNLRDLNSKLEDEATKGQAGQEALRKLNLGLGEIVAERTGELQDMSAILEEKVMERQVVLAKANAYLEARVQERTNQLQEINATLEKEIMERQATEDALQKSRDALLVREQQLEYYADEVAAANTELKSFVHTIAHDFRSPMVNLVGFSTELGYSLAELQQTVQEYESFLPEDAQIKVNKLLETDMPEAQTFIKSAVTRLSRMVDALLNLSRLGRREMRYEEVDMSKLVNTIVHSFKHQITEKHIQVMVGMLPKIKIDYLVMEQIISNLLDNAIK